MQKQPCQPIPLYEFQNIDPERNIESMNNQHSFRHRGVCAMAMPKLMFCILASLAVLVATSCPDYLVNRTRCNPVNDIVGTSAATCQDDPDFYIENLGDDFKETQLTQLITPQKLYIYVYIYIYLFAEISAKGQEILLHFHLDQHFTLAISSFFCLG